MPETQITKIEINIPSPPNEEYCFCSFDKKSIKLQLTPESGRIEVTPYISSMVGSIIGEK